MVKTYASISRAELLERKEPWIAIATIFNRLGIALNLTEDTVLTIFKNWATQNKVQATKESLRAYLDTFNEDTIYFALLKDTVSNKLYLHVTKEKPPFGKDISKKW